MSKNSKKINSRALIINLEINWEIIDLKVVPFVKEQNNTI